MKVPRVRFSVRRMIVAVAMVAVLLGWAIRRPYPLLVSCSASCLIVWSDGSTTMTREGPRVRENSWLLIVDWPDGRTGYYLKPWFAYRR